MAKPCCGQDTCSCIITGGAGISVTGAGTTVSPYVVAASGPAFSSVFQVLSTPSVALRLTGSGTEGDPLQLQAQTSISVESLTDVTVGGGPVAGQSLVYSGTYPSGHWVFAALPPTPAGAVNVGAGISGDGTVGTPIAAKISGTWGSGGLSGLGSDSTIGLDTYIDSAGKIRVTPTTAFLSWSTITGKPTYFAVDPTTSWLAANISDPTNLNVGKILGQRLYSAQTSSPTPTSPAPAIGDVFVFPRGS